MLAAVSVGRRVVGALVWLIAAAFPGRRAADRLGPGGPALMAAAFLNVPLLTWIAEDNHWRGRLLPSRPWPVAARPACRLRWRWPGPTGVGWDVAPRS